MTGRRGTYLIHLSCAELSLSRKRVFHVKQTSLQSHVERMNRRAKSNHMYWQDWNNESPAAWLSKESRDALEGKIARVCVDFIHLAVYSITEHNTLRGWTTPGGSCKLQVY